MTDTRDKIKRISEAGMCLFQHSRYKNVLHGKLFTCYGYAALICCFFVFLTIALYASLSKLRSLHGRNLICYFITIIFINVLDATIFLADERSWCPFCIVYVYLYIYSTISSFCWLNVLCLDITLKFSKITPIDTSKKYSKKFQLYSLYAWGCPLVFMLVCYIADNVRSVNLHVVKPDIGLYRCWFGDYVAQVIYFNTPVTVLIAANVILFVTTTVKLIRHRRDTSILKIENNSIKQQFYMYSKLMIVMGVYKVGELVIIMYKPAFDPSWTVCILYAAQGVCIFLIFVCNRKTSGYIREELHDLRRKIISVYFQHSAIVTPSNNGEIKMSDVDTKCTTKNTDY